MQIADALKAPPFETEADKKRRKGKQLGHFVTDDKHKQASLTEAGLHKVYIELGKSALSP